MNSLLNCLSYVSSKCKKTNSELGEHIVPNRYDDEYNDEKENKIETPITLSDNINSKKSMLKLNLDNIENKEEIRKILVKSHDHLFKDVINTSSSRFHKTSIQNKKDTSLQDMLSILERKRSSVSISFNKDTLIKNNTQESKNFYKNYKSNYINDSEIKQSPCLLIEELEGNLLNDKNYIINAGGLVNCNNQRKKGLIYFGSNSKTSKFKCEVELNLANDFNLEYVFLISYNKDNKLFYIKGNEFSFSSIFFLPSIQMQLISEYILRSKEIVSIGSTIFLIERSKEDIAIYQLNQKGEKIKEFLFNQKNKNTIFIGNDKNCDVATLGLGNQTIQATLFWNNNNWILKDGTKYSISTISSWIYFTHSFEIRSGMILRIYGSKLIFNFTTINK